MGWGRGLFVSLEPVCTVTGVCVRTRVCVPLSEPDDVVAVCPLRRLRLPQ